MEAGTRARRSQAHSKVPERIIAPESVLVKHSHPHSATPIDTQPALCDTVAGRRAGLAAEEAVPPLSLSRLCGHHCMDTSHLHGLIRLSTCCHAELSHPYTDSAHFEVLICLSCRKPVVGDHELWNDRGERVWPILDTNLPPLPPRRRSRRKPQDAEPEPYPLHLPTHLRGGLR